MSLCVGARMVHRIALKSNIGVSRGPNDKTSASTVTPSLSRHSEYRSLALPGKLDWNSLPCLIPPTETPGR